MSVSEILLGQLGTNLEMTQTFWEWRHKVITRFAVAVGAVVFGYGKLPPTSDLRPLVLLAGSLIAVYAGLLNHATHQILQGLYDNGMRIEDELDGLLNPGQLSDLSGTEASPDKPAPDIGAFYAMENRHRFRYHVIFAWVYWMTAALFALAIPLLPRLAGGT